MSQEEADTEVITADLGEEMSPLKNMDESTSQSTAVIIDKNNNDSYTTTTSSNSNNNNKSTDDIVIITCNNNNGVPENTENNKNHNSSHAFTTGAKQSSPNSRNNQENDNNSFIIMSEDTDDNSNSDLINNIQHMINNTNHNTNNNNNSSNKIHQNSFMNENDATYRSSSNNFRTVTSISSTNNRIMPMNGYVSSNNTNFIQSFNPNISYTTTNTTNSNFMMPSSIHHTNNSYNSHVVRPKQIPTFNNPQLNVLTPQIKNNSNTRLKAPTQQQLDNREIQIEKIVTRKFEGGKMYYRIQWEGYPRKCNTWLSADRLGKYKDVLEEHDRRNRKLTEVLSSCTTTTTKEQRKPNPVDHNSFMAGNFLSQQPRPFAKKIKLDPDISNGWTPHKIINNNNNNINPIHVHNYSSNPPYPSQFGLQRVLPTNLPSGIPLQHFSSISASSSSNNNNGSNPDLMTNNYDDICNYTTHEDNIKREGKHLIGSGGYNSNSVGLFTKPNISSWNMKTPTQSPVRVVPRTISKILPNVLTSPAVMDYPVFPVLPMPQSEQYHILYPISSIDFVHEGNMTIFTIQFSQCATSLPLKFQRKQVKTLTQTNHDGARKSPLMPQNTPNNADKEGQDSSHVSPASSSFLPSTSLMSEHNQQKTIVCTDQNAVASTTTTTATSTRVSSSSSSSDPPVSKLHLLDPLITIEEICCKNGTDVIVKAILEKEKQSKYFPLSDVYKIYPDYLYCFVLNETMRLRPNCVNLT